MGQGCAGNELWSSVPLCKAVINEDDLEDRAGNREANYY